MKKTFIALFFLLITATSLSQTIIQMKKEGGVSVVPCKVNGLSLSFIFDTGASDVTISLTEASFMLKNGYLKKEDFIGSEKYLDATGSVSEGIIINLREIEIQGLVLHNVKASIVKTLNAPLLLGQSALTKLGNIKLNLEKNQLTIDVFSKINATAPTNNIPAKVDFSIYKKGFINLVQSLNGTDIDTNVIAETYSLNKSDIENKDSLWAIPFDAYKTYNASSYFYTFSNNKTISESINQLKVFSKDKSVNWSLFDSSSLTITIIGTDELLYTFKCSDKSYSLITAFDYLTIKSSNPKIYLPVKIDSKDFFTFRNRVFGEFTNKVENIKYSNDQNKSLSYFYDNLIYRLEKNYSNLSSTDKNLFSTIDFEPSYWCERAANLKGLFLGDDEETLLKKLSLFTKGISLYETNEYPFTKKSYRYLFLYSYRAECKYKMEDYDGAYKDYKKAIDIYEQNIASRDALKTSITEIYYDFSNVCYYLKRFTECNAAIQKGIATYSTDMDKYLVNVTLYRLYNLKGYLNYFIYKNKHQACKDWSRAGELGDKEAFEFIKKYCGR